MSIPRRALNGDHNQCPSCGEYFNSSASFDGHRYGKHTGNLRKCLTVDQMTAKGMSVDSGGWWITSARPPR